MNDDEFKHFLKELMRDLEVHLIQNSSMTHVIHSLKDMQALVEIEEYWLHKIFISNISTQDLQQLESIGKNLNQLYQLADSTLKCNG